MIWFLPLVGFEMVQAGYTILRRQPSGMPLSPPRGGIPERLPLFRFAIKLRSMGMRPWMLMTGMAALSACASGPAGDPVRPLPSEGGTRADARPAAEVGSA